MTQTTWIVGAGGIGTALANALQSQKDNVVLISRKAPNGALKSMMHQLDSDDEVAVENYLSKQELPNKLIIASGILHDDQHKPEKTLAEFDESWLQQNFAANVRPTISWAKAITPHLTPKTSIKMACFSARVGSITDNRLGGWYSYRMTKAMLNMLVKNIALEWHYKSPQSVIYTYHPGTVATPLSEPFRKNIKHEVFSPEKAAQYCLSVLKEVKPQQSGLFFDWQNQKIEF